MKDYGAYDMVGSYDNDDYLITIVNGVYTIGERLVEVTVTEPKDIVYGDTTNPTSPSTLLPPTATARTALLLSPILWA